MAQKLTQEEMLKRLNEEPFNQSKAVPADAVIEHSPEARWWRSDSPRAGEHPDLPPQHADPRLSATSGVLGTGQRDGPGNFHTQYQTGSGTAAHYKEESATKTISGYSGHIAGKYAGNVIGGTFNKSNDDAVKHLQTTSQASKYPGPQ
mmetsp:Transcript_76401/g.247404  ORF Transcript_76401/g.247404 Transcript_76401/m.247404 type:complete len:148 (+) Transcript_76401:91-534(+)